MNDQIVDLQKTGLAFAYVFVMDWRAGIVALLQVAMHAEKIAPGCLTGSTNVRR